MTLTFDQVAANCTPAERDALAWHLACFRARRTYEALRPAVRAEPLPGFPSPQASSEAGR